MCSVPPVYAAHQKQSSNLLANVVTALLGAFVLCHSIR